MSNTLGWFHAFLILAVMWALYTMAAMATGGI